MSGPTGPKSSCTRRSLDVVQCKSIKGLEFHTFQLLYRSISLNLNLDFNGQTEQVLEGVQHKHPPKPCSYRAKGAGSLLSVLYLALTEPSQMKHKTEEWDSQGMSSYLNEGGMYSGGSAGGSG